MKIRFLIKALITALVFSAILFISAGNIFYFNGYLFLATNLITGLANFLTIQTNTALLEERSSIKTDAKNWDKRLLAISAVVYLINVVVAGLDSGRFQWTGPIPLTVPLLGVFMTLIGQMIFLLARHQNKFFSSIVRIQSERGHSVCSTGIYKYIRHPGYLGMIISLCGFPMLTASFWSIVPTFLSVLLLLIRTNMEDVTLQLELNGYKAYAHTTKYKLIPKVW